MTVSRPESVFLENLDWIDRVSARLCRRHGLDGADAEDAAAWVRMRMIEDDYSAIRRFRGESAITTYLTVVVSMLFRDYRAARWGRWRPSAEALRRGPAAVRLEALVRRDGLSLGQAAESMRSDGFAVLTDMECARLLAALPERTPLRPEQVGVDDFVDPPDPNLADAAVQGREAAVRRLRVERALEDALATLANEDRVLVRLRYWQGLSVADAARALGVPQKPLYRRLERAIGALREALDRAGIGPDDTAEVLGEIEVTDAARAEIVALRDPRAIREKLRAATD
jgi:RNA polymerase sigma factor (sigma-70 family)